MNKLHDSIRHVSPPGRSIRGSSWIGDVNPMDCGFEIQIVGEVPACGELIGPKDTFYGCPALGCKVVRDNATSVHGHYVIRHLYSALIYWCDGRGCECTFLSREAADNHRLNCHRGERLQRELGVAKLVRISKEKEIALWILNPRSTTLSTNLRDRQARFTLSHGGRVEARIGEQLTQKAVDVPKEQLFYTLSGDSQGVKTLAYKSSRPKANVVIRNAARLPATSTPVTSTVTEPLPAPALPGDTAALEEELQAPDVSIELPPQTTPEQPPASLPIVTADDVERACQTPLTPAELDGVQVIDIGSSASSIGEGELDSTYGAEDDEAPAIKLIEVTLDNGLTVLTTALASSEAPVKPLASSEPPGKTVVTRGKLTIEAYRARTPANAPPLVTTLPDDAVPALDLTVANNLPTTSAQPYALPPVITLPNDSVPTLNLTVADQLQATEEPMDIAGSTDDASAHLTQTEDMEADTLSNHASSHTDPGENDGSESLYSTTASEDSLDDSQQQWTEFIRAASGNREDADKTRDLIEEYGIDPRAIKTIATTGNSYLAVRDADAEPRFKPRVRLDHLANQYLQMVPVSTQAHPTGPRYWVDLDSAQHYVANADTFRIPLTNYVNQTLDIVFDPTTWTNPTVGMQPALAAQRTIRDTHRFLGAVLADLDPTLSRAAILAAEHAEVAHQRSELQHQATLIHVEAERDAAHDALRALGAPLP